MTVPHEDGKQRARRWATFADEDLRLAEYSMTMEPPRPHRLVAYHAQQCAEKHLKAWLVLGGVDFPFTHNISSLIELCEPTAPWAAGLADSETLTAYAVTARYPGLEPDVTEVEAREAIALARRVRQVVREAMRQAGVVL